MTSASDARTAATQFRESYARIKDAVQSVIVGQDETLHGTLTALFAGGHALLEGVPGIGKTALVKALGSALDLSMSRIQFTPDLMPTDVVGTMVLDDEGGRRTLRHQKGPIHANLVLADEINRATPKTQAALLEAMQELQVTTGGETRPLPKPFAVLATQNPVEQEGTYPLPEAQLDRFLFKLVVGYPREEEYDAILNRTTGTALPTVPKVADIATLLAMRDTVREIPVPDAARQAAIRLVMATQPGSPYAGPLVNRHVALGASPRGAQALVLAAKVTALRDGRHAASTDDVLAWAKPALRHRVLLRFSAAAEGVTSDVAVEEAIASVSALR